MGAEKLVEIIDVSTQQLRVIGAEASLTDRQIENADKQAENRLFSITRKAGEIRELYLAWVFLISELYRQFDLNTVQTFWADEALVNQIPFANSVVIAKLDLLWNKDPRVLLVNDKRIPTIEKVLKTTFKNIGSIALIPVFDKGGNVIACLVLGDSNVYRYDPRRKTDLLEGFSQAITRNVLT